MHLSTFRIIRNKHIVSVWWLVFTVHNAASTTYVHIFELYGNAGQLITTIHLSEFSNVRRRKRCRRRRKIKDGIFCSRYQFQSVNVQKTSNNNRERAITGLKSNKLNSRCHNGCLAVCMRARACVCTFASERNKPTANYTHIHICTHVDAHTHTNRKDEIWSERDLIFFAVFTVHVCTSCCAYEENTHTFCYLVEENVDGEFPEFLFYCVQSNEMKLNVSFKRIRNKNNQNKNKAKTNFRTKWKRKNHTNWAIHQNQTWSWD